MDIVMRTRSRGTRCRDDPVGGRRPRSVAGDREALVPAGARGHARRDDCVARRV